MSLKINAMAPLVVGDPADFGSDFSRTAWWQFDQHLAIMKQAGISAISTDVWWGLIEPVEGQFSWSYYDKLSDHIIAAGLKWIPILSLHQCGGNIGDDASVPIPSWIWPKLALQTESGLVDAVKFVSEQGNASLEYVSFWATDLVLPNYITVMKEFQSHFASKATSIAEVNVSLGPAGELRYPSYNCHDTNSGWPTRGALQCYSELARTSFHNFVVEKYGDEKNAAKSWGRIATSIEPPPDVESFFKLAKHRRTQFGLDLFDWYADTLINHGRTVLTAAQSVFDGDGAAFAGIDIGAKIPGVHWRLGTRKGNRVWIADRLPELAAGLIRTSGKDWRRDRDGRGYRPLLSLFSQLQRESGSRLVVHFTCLEMPDGVDGPAVRSLPQSLVNWVGQEAHRAGVPIKGENALGYKLYSRDAWRLMRTALAVSPQTGAYEGLTLLRMSDLVNSAEARDELDVTIKFVQAVVTVGNTAGSGTRKTA